MLTSPMQAGNKKHDWMLFSKVWTTYLHVIFGSQFHISVHPRPPEDYKVATFYELKTK